MNIFSSNRQLIGKGLYLAKGSFFYFYMHVLCIIIDPDSGGMFVKLLLLSKEPNVNLYSRLESKCVFGDLQVHYVPASVFKLY